MDNSGNFVATETDFCYNDVSNINRFIANKNPFRYRSYYYDFETDLYYLNSRYYDPEIGRFINIDKVNILGKTKNVFNGINLFMYCNNNPIILIDKTGAQPYNNVINRIQYSEIVWSLFDINNIWFNIYQKQIINVQVDYPNGFYSFSEIENNKTTRIGIGFIYDNQFGAEAYLDVTGYNIGLKLQISPMYYIGIQVGLDGIGIQVGITTDGITTEYGINIGISTLFMLTLSRVISSVANVFAAGIKEFISWVNSIHIF